ncbi:glycoside hydrolase family protein [Haloterrigena salina JCM 13891]|uniref:Glycoside hydrolase family protein n=1 Tax=Haloterrigena salina JCM 13891 TaxID=1227488 RepID=M0CRC5_9EURY|nr:glycoside hydrolase [Haloterrigena salina]ELZ24424.1 glycoside hydrolase family protein [Haloterrigena salina JCM 13891]
MHRLEERVPSQSRSSVKIGYVGGGSHGWAHTLVNDLLQCDDLAGTVSLYDVDYDAAERNARLANSLADRPDANGAWTFEARRDVDDALADADYVICSIQDPVEETFVHDIDVPQEYGIYQTVADTVGPGGVLRSLRAIPQYREIAATVREQCPDAWVVNYTNPMTVCTRALYEEFPDINAIGLCHEVFETQRLLADVAERYVDAAEDVAADEIEVNVKGVNHFTWVDEAYWNGRDVFQYLDRELEERKPIPGFEPGDLDGESYWTNHHQTAFDLYDRFGLLGAAGDRHLAEFVPWYLDIDEPREIQRWGIRLTPSSARTGDDEGPAKMERYLSGDEAFEFTESGEEVVDIVRALEGLEPIKTHVNHPNRGQTPDLPTGAVVETNAVITGGGVAPITAGDLPREVRSMVLTAVNNQETLIEAGFAGDLDLAFRAFLNDPLVTVQRDEARDLFADLVDLERDYLRDYDLEGAAVLED